MFESHLHTLETPLGTLTFDRDTAARPRMFLTRIADDVSIDREIVRYPEQDLSYIGDGYANARILTCAGVLQADSVESFMQTRQVVRGALNRMLREDGVLRWQPYGFEPVQMTVRRYEKPLIAARSAAEGLLLSLVAADPRVYAQAEQMIVIAPAPNTGFTSPFTGPIMPTGTGADSVSTNGGDTDTLPVSRIYGPCANPALLNITTGQQLVFEGLTIPDGEYVEVDHATATVRLNGSPVASRYAYVDASRSRFFALEPGANDVRLIASSAGVNTRAEMTWRSAWMP